MADDKRVLIAGGGPVGLITGLALVQAGVPVTIFEQNETLLDDPRAATTHPATLELLDSIGVLDEVKAQGLVAPTFQFWDRPSGQLVAEFDHALLKGETPHPYVVQTEQFKTARIVKERLDKEKLCDLQFSSPVVDVAHDATGVTVTIESNGKRRQERGAYLIGADGGRSTVRKSTGIAFEGFTYAERFLVLTTPFDFEKERGYCYRSYFADPDEWCNCFKVRGYTETGLWRTVYPADPNVPEEELMTDENAQARLQRFFPNSKPYDIHHKNIYNVHQRVAERFRRGRVLLAGDSAHVNNSIGGMGLNGGIQDAVNLAGKLARVFHGDAPESELDLYDLQRRTVVTKFVQEQTIENKKRLEARDPEQRKRNLDQLREIAADPERAKAFLMRTSMIAMQRQAAAVTLAG